MSSRRAAARRRRAGGGPIVIEGVDTVDVTAISALLFALDHSGYAEASALLQDIQLLIQIGERPPDKRVPILERGRPTQATTGAIRDRGPDSCPMPCVDQPLAVVVRPVVLAQSATNRRGSRFAPQCL